MVVGSVYIDAGCWLCPGCNKCWHYLVSLPELFIQDQTKLTKDAWRINVLCNACNRLSRCTKDNFPVPHPDTECPGEFISADKIFRVQARCDEGNCDSPVTILSPTLKNWYVQYFRTHASGWKIGERITCAKGRAMAKPPVNVVPKLLDQRRV